MQLKYNLAFAHFVPLWQILPMIKTIRTLEQLATSGLVPTDHAASLSPVLEEYALGISPAMAALIATENRNGPISQQFIPDLAELTTHPAEIDDPIGDHPHSPVKGIIHRYPDRVLFKPVHQCAVYCRFCFRREQVGPGKDALNDHEWQAAFDYIAATPTIREVILSGGDPLILSARRLKAIYQALENIPHVRIVRIHTRVPVVAPENITPAMIDALKGQKPVYIAIHTNHASEWTPAARAATALLADAGFPLLSQTVLLRGVNNQVEDLENLIWTLLDNRVRPYYLHHGDLARGTGHFRTSIAEGLALMAALHSRNSGISLPHYILDTPGGQGKVVLSPDMIEIISPGHYRVKTRLGHVVSYHDTAHIDT